MRTIRWYELPEARRLAGLGKGLSRTGETRLQWMLFYFFNGRNAQRTCRHFQKTQDGTLRTFVAFNSQRTRIFDDLTTEGRILNLNDPDALAKARERD